MSNIENIITNLAVSMDENGVAAKALRGYIIYDFDVVPEKRIEIYPSRRFGIRIAK